MTEQAPGRFIIEATVAGCSAEISVNGVPLISWDGMFGNDITWFVNQWVRTGENTIEVKVGEGPGGVAQDASIVVALNYYEPDPDAFIGDAPHETIIKAEWSPAEGVDATSQVPHSFSGSGKIDRSWPRWAHLDATRVELSDELLRDAVAIYRGVFDAVKAKDIKALDEAFAIPYRETDIAFGREPGKTRADQIYIEAWQDPSWGLAEVGIQQLMVRIYDQGRLIELTDREGKTPFRARDDVSDYRFQRRLFMAVVDGDLEIVR